MSTPLIGLLDCNNFFVSCERLFRPDLIGKPVLVLSSNDGCVVARSQEVKDIGVSMGVPYFQIKDMVKKHDITVFSSHFSLYRDVSRRVFAVMRAELPMVEQYSIDEAFFRLDGDSEMVAKHLKATVEQSVGIPVSVGVAPTKTLAKLANAKAKKASGIHVIDIATLPEFASSTPLAAIWGVGGKLELRYKQHGMLTVADLIAADSARIEKLFGVTGRRLQKELQGISALPLQPKHEPQRSIMSSRSFPKTTADCAILADAIAYHVRHAAADLRAQSQLAARLAVAIRPSRHGDFLLRGGSKEVLLAAPTNDTFVLLKAAHDLLIELFEAGVPYKKAGVILSGLCPAGGGEQSLFESSPHEEQNPLLSIVDELNKKKGKEIVLLGSHLSTAKWQSRADVRSPAYTTQWNEIAVVKAM